MRCSCCDKALSDYESTLKHATTHEYLDTCVKCIKGLSIPCIGRDDLLGKQEAAEEDETLDMDFFFEEELDD